MKLSRLVSLSLLVAGLSVAVSAQTLQTAPAVPVAAASTAPAAKVIEPARVACVNSGAFLAPEGGIKVLVRAAQGLDLEFSSTQSELSLLNEKLRTLVGELQKLSADQVANAKAIEAKQMEGQKLQQDLQQKQQAAQASYQQRQQETFGPLMQAVGADLQAFAKERNFSLLLDLSKLGEGVLFMKPEIDVSEEFIARYNKNNP
jgi:Skp family chaperone for outer membrane proteins